MRALAIVGLITAVAISAQTTPPSAPVVHIQAELASAIKLAKAKVGDKLTARTAAAVNLANGTPIPAGSTLVGEVRQVDASSVTIAFSQVNADGHKMPLDLTLVAAAQMGGPRTEMSEGNANIQMNTASGGGVADDHPLGGSRRSIGTMGTDTLNGVSHESVSEVNAGGKGAAVRRGPDVPAHAGSVIGMPGITLTVDDGPPYASKFDLANSKDHQLPKGIQLMFTVR